MVNDSHDSVQKLNVLAISYGRQLFNPENRERKRMAACAAAVGSYHMIIFTDQSEGYTKTVAENGLVLHPTNARFKWQHIWLAIRLGLQILRATKGTRWVITAQDPFEPALIGLILRWRTGFPLNIQEHSDIFSLSHWRREKFLNRVRYVFGLWALRRADSVRVVARRIANTLQAQGIDQSIIMQLPVRTDALAGVSGSVEWPSSIPPDALIVLTMARLCDQKNLFLLINAFQRVAAKCPNAHLVIIGKGPREAQLRLTVTQLQISDQVTFLPWTEQPLDYMSAADVYVLSSDYEGWGRVLVEAMAVGTPVVTTDVGCAGEIFINDTHGLIVPVRDEHAFAQALFLLCADSERRRAYGAAGKRDVANIHISLPEYAQRWATILNQTLIR